MLAADQLTALRQGDVCTVPFFPRWVSSSPTIVINGGITAVQMAGWDAVQKADDGSSLVVVCSHDCDVENPRSRTGILLAPVVKVPARSGDDRHEQIMASHTPVANDFDYINLFPLILEVSTGELAAVVDLSAMISYGPPGVTVRNLRVTKKFEMADAERRLFKTKLAAFVGRG